MIYYITKLKFYASSLVKFKFLKFFIRLRQIGVVFATCCKKSEGPSLWRATESWTHVRKLGSFKKIKNYFPKIDFTAFTVAMASFP